MPSLTQATVHRLVPAYVAWVEHQRHERCVVCYRPGHVMGNCPTNRPIPRPLEELEAAGIKPKSRRRRPKGRTDGETPGTQLPPGEPEQLSLF